MANIGLSYQEFAALDVCEFESIYKSYIDQRNFDYKDNWERVRMLGAILLQPHLSEGKRLLAKDILQFPWDKSEEKAHIDVAAQRKRMEKLVKQLGDELI